MSAFALQQAAFLHALGANSHEAAAALLSPHLAAAPATYRGLVAYRSNGLVLAQRVLAAAYPRTAALLGEDNFGPLAVRLWREQPPARGDLAEWGEGFAGLLAGIAALVEDQPALPDVARVEWLLHRIATAADGAADLASLALLVQQPAGSVRLHLAPGVAWIDSRFAVVDLLEAGEVADARGPAQVALVWRDGWRPRVRAALPGEGLFLASLLRGDPLDTALSAAPALDFAAWLPVAVDSGLLLGAATCDHPGETP